jgi:hypothetical protein
MSIAEATELAAGREMDARVYERVFGCVPRLTAIGYVCSCDDGRHNTNEDGQQGLPRVSEEWGTMRFVVWEMDCGFRLERPSECTWVAAFLADGENWTYGERCAEAPEAICRAALEAAGQR